ncbi:thioredoxin family protein [Streptomyces sp. NPDC051561]|uniref:thioredoxin family protein n=1 Tax=Streptomyces sp. NPDC051561 TaxID=3365658 RepID=UPI0037B7A1D9
MASRIHQPMESEEFDFILARAATPVLAHFIGTWPKAVAACKETDAVVRDVAEEYDGRLTVIRADIARCQAPVKRYGVTSAPTLLLIRDGEQVAAEAGPLDAAALRAFLETNL